MKIIINAQKKELDLVKELSYPEIVILAGYKDTGRTYTVVYECRQRQGNIFPGSSVELEEGMIINVADTSAA